MKPVISLEQKLRELPQFDPPAGGWADLDRRLHPRTRRQRLYASFALAASVLIAFGVTLRLPQSPLPDAVAPDDIELVALMAQSQRLEQSLGAIKPRVVVWDSRYAAAAGDLESDLAVVDLQLNYAEPASARRLWRNRVALMSRLVQTHQQAALLTASYPVIQEQSL